jgi:hypothetical protein
MYDEFERAVTGRARRGPSALGWVLIALGSLFVIGVLGTGVAAFYVHRKVEQFASGMVRQIQRGPAEVGAAVLSSLESHARLLEADPTEGLAFLRTLPSDGAPEAGILDLASLDLSSMGRISERRNLAEVEGREQVDRGARGRDRSMEEGGDVSVSMRGDRDGGYLVIRGRDGEVRFDLTRTDDGGSLVVDSNEGQVRFDLRRGDDGGELVVETEEGTLRFGAGDRAQALPGWVPRLGGIPSEPRSVYSLTSPEGFLGAVAWEGREPPAEVLASYRGWLEREGYELQMEHRLREGGRDQGSLWARQEGQRRVVFLVAAEDEAGTRVLLGYGEGG